MAFPNGEKFRDQAVPLCLGGGVIESAQIAPVPRERHIGQNDSLLAAVEQKENLRTPDVAEVRRSIF